MQQQRQNVSVNQNHQNKTDSIALALQRYRLASIVESKINLGTIILSSPSLTSEDMHPLTIGNKLWAFSSPVKTFSFLRAFLSLVAQLVVSISGPLLASCWDEVRREALFWTQHHRDICDPQHTKWASERHHRYCKSNARWEGGAGYLPAPWTVRLWLCYGHCPVPLGSSYSQGSTAAVTGRPHNNRNFKWNLNYHLACEQSK